jgi:hypothetical protein
MNRRVALAAWTKLDSFDELDARRVSRFIATYERTFNPEAFQWSFAAAFAERDCGAVLRSRNLGHNRSCTFVAGVAWLSFCGGDRATISSPIISYRSRLARAAGPARAQGL